MNHMRSERVHTSKAALWGLFLLLAYLVIASWCVTEWLASRFGPQPELGQRGALGLFGPFDWLVWMWKYYRSAPEWFGQGVIAWAISAAVGFLVYVMLVGFVLRNIKAHHGIHGTAHFASFDEAREAGLLPRKGEENAGVYLGAMPDKNGRRHYLRHDGPEHVAVIAPTRSGKGVSNVTPTLLSWPASVVVNDMKGELWQMTSGWRQAEGGNRVMKFDPASVSGSVAFNPLDEVRLRTDHEAGDVQNLVTIIVDPDGKGMTDHWSKTAHAFLTGVVLHLKYLSSAEGKTASLADVAFALSDPSRKVEDLYTDMLKNGHLEQIDPTTGEVTKAPHPIVAAAARDMLNRAENERSGVLSTAMSFLSLYRDPLVARNVSRSDFSISDLMNHDTPVSLYLVIRPEDQDRMRPLVRLVINQIVRGLLRPEITFENGRAIPPHKHRLLMMLDEFPSYGRLDVFQESLAYIAGYGIKAFLIMQDISQLQNAYGRDESIIANCHVRIAFAPNKQETGRWLSDNCGVQTVIKENITTSGQRFGAFLQSVSRSYQETQRPLLTADEAMRLRAAQKDGRDQIVAPGEVIVLTAGYAPIKADQSLYFLDPVFRERVKFNAPIRSDVLRAAVPVQAVAAPPKTAPAPATRAAFKLSDEAPAATSTAPDPGVEAAMSDEADAASEDC